MRMKKLVDRDSMLRVQQCGGSSPACRFFFLRVVLQEVLETARERINAIAATPAYAELLTGFIVQVGFHTRYHT